MRRRNGPYEAARFRRALEEIALLCAAYEAHQATAESVAYEAGRIAAGQLQGQGGKRR